eukprot:5682571-Pyramimonas_sp.AAC.1
MNLVELFGKDELEEFRRGVELVGRRDQNGQCGNFWLVLLRFEGYLTIYFEKPDFCAKHTHFTFVLTAAQLSTASFTMCLLPGTDFILIPKIKYSEKLPAPILTTVTRARSSTRFPAVTRPLVIGLAAFVI